MTILSTTRAGKQPQKHAQANSAAQIQAMSSQPLGPNQMHMLLSRLPTMSTQDLTVVHTSNSPGGYTQLASVYVQRLTDGIQLQQRLRE